MEKHEAVTVVNVDRVRSMGPGCKWPPATDGFGSGPSISLVLFEANALGE